MRRMVLQTVLTSRGNGRNNRPVRLSRQAKPAPARHLPDPRSARPERWRFHCNPDRMQGVRKELAVFKTTFGRARRRGKQSPPPRTRLQLESLESRCVLSTLHLTPLVQASGADPFVACAPPGWPINVEVEPQLAV